MASVLITSWQKKKKWGKMEIMTLFSWAPKITVDGDCSHEIKRHLLPERKPIT